MPEKKTLKRTFESELRSLQLEMVPPDPSGASQNRKSFPSGEAAIRPFGAESERGVLDKLINRIKSL